jgi:hypothetical protein
MRDNDMSNNQHSEAPATESSIAPPQWFLLVPGFFVGFVVGILVSMALIMKPENESSWQNGVTVGLTTAQIIAAKRDGRSADYQFFSSRLASHPEWNLKPDWLQEMIDSVPFKQDAVK